MYKRIICSADWHLSRSTPISRIDTDYFQTSLDKVKQLVLLAKKYEACLFVAGDIFDSMRVTPYMINALTEVLKGVKVYTVAGQHDMEYRNLSDACAYNTLRNTGAIHHVQGTETITIAGRDYKLLGISFTDDIPSKTDADIVLIHKTITKGNPPFFLKDAIKSTDLMKLFSKSKFIISGDYHVPFAVKNDKQVLINCGSLMRKAKDQIDYEPNAWNINVQNKVVQRVPLAIKPAKEVFSFSAQNVSEEITHTENEAMQRVIERLTKNNLKPNFENILFTMAAQKNLKEEELCILKDVLETARGGVVE